VNEYSHDAASYGAGPADYDAIYGGVFDTESAVELLTTLSTGGRVLEFGVARAGSRSPWRIEVLMYRASTAHQACSSD
jgi:hypothetical protein